MASPSLFGFEHKVIVGIADLAASNNPNVILTTYSLGSCLGITIYDPVTQAGGLLHAMLPDSTIDTGKARANPAMFIDTGFPLLLQTAIQLKAEPRRLLICVAGGAQIMDNSGFFNIGKRNCEALNHLLQQYNLSVTACQVGGLVNRTMHLKLATGEVTLKVSGQTGEMTLCKR
jgi:chemotaxis protein CheD